MKAKGRDRLLGKAVWYQDFSCWYKGEVVDVGSGGWYSIQPDDRPKGQCLLVSPSQVKLRSKHRKRPAPMY